MCKFEVGRKYKVLHNHDRNQATTFTVVSRTDEAVTVLLNGRRKTLAVTENAFNNSEMCCPAGYRLVDATYVEKD